MPLEAHGIKVMSIGFFVQEDSAVVWRGPMLHKALTQFLEDVDWGELDYLLVDLPPGTGDVSMTLAQLLPQAQFLIVTTPQPAAQKVARRAAEMAHKVDLEIAGVVENMSGFTTPGGERFQIFGEGGGQELADELDVPLLGKVPLTMPLREQADAGVPLVAPTPTTPPPRRSVRPPAASSRWPRRRSCRSSRSTSGRRAARGGTPHVGREPPDGRLTPSLPPGLAREWATRGRRGTGGQVRELVVGVEAARVREDPDRAAADGVGLQADAGARVAKAVRKAVMPRIATSRGCHCSASAASAATPATQLRRRRSAAARVGRSTRFVTPTPKPRQLARPRRRRTRGVKPARCSAGQKRLPGRAKW